MKIIAKIRENETTETTSTTVVIASTDAPDRYGDIVDQACLLWNILHYVILNYQERYPSWLFVKYENLANNPVEGFQEVFDYIGMKLDGKIRNTIIEFTSERNPADAGTTIFKPRNSKASLLTWQTRLTSEEVDKVITQTKTIASYFYNNFV